MFNNACVFSQPPPHWKQAASQGKRFPEPSNSCKPPQIIKFAFAMAYEIRVLTCSPAKLETQLNIPAAEGWQLVSCWPEKDHVIAVLQRPATPAARAQTPPLSEPSATLPAELPDLGDVLQACLKQPERKNEKGQTFRQALPIAELASAHNVGEAELLAHLQALGIKLKGQGGKDKWHADYFLTLVEFKNKKLYLSITHAPAKKGRK